MSQKNKKVAAADKEDLIRDATPQSEASLLENLSSQYFLKACEEGLHIAASYAQGIDIPKIPCLQDIQKGLSLLILKTATQTAQEILEHNPQLYQKLNTIKLFNACAIKNQVALAQHLVKKSSAYNSFNKFTLQAALELAARYNNKEMTAYLLFSSDFTESARPSFYTNKANAFIFACEHAKKDYLSYLIHEVKVSEDNPHIALYLKKHNFSLKKEVLEFFEFEKNYQKLLLAVPLDEKEKIKPIHKI